LASAGAVATYLLLFPAASVVLSRSGQAQTSAARTAASRSNDPNTFG
jgi:hypothetical protein